MYIPSHNRIISLLPSSFISKDLNISYILKTGMTWNNGAFWYSGTQSYLAKAREAKTPADQIIREVLSLDGKVRGELGAKTPEYQQYHATVMKDVKTEISALGEERARIGQTVDQLRGKIGEISDLLRNTDHVEKPAKASPKPPKKTYHASETISKGTYTREKAFKELGWEYTDGMAYKIFAEDNVSAREVNKLKGHVIYTQAVPRLAKKTGLSEGTLNSAGWRQKVLDKKFLVSIGHSKKVPIMAYKKADEAKIVEYLKNR